MTALLLVMLGSSAGASLRYVVDRGIQSRHERVFPFGTMTINVVERSREIGVLRAVGASDRSVLTIFLVEGVLIGALSWVIGVLGSLPISRLLSDALGIVFADRPLSHASSIEAALAWAGIVLALAAVASLLPSWRASRLAVREILAYE